MNQMNFISLADKQEQIIVLDNINLNKGQTYLHDTSNAQNVRT